jgi:hypothetical protein
LAQLTFADHELAKALARGALPGVALDQRRKSRDDLVVADVLTVQLVQPSAVEGRTELQVVFARGSPDQPDHGEIQARAASSAGAKSATLRPG